MEITEEADIYDVQYKTTSCSAYGAIFLRDTSENYNKDKIKRKKQNHGAGGVNDDGDGEKGMMADRMLEGDWGERSDVLEETVMRYGRGKGHTRGM